MASDHNGLVLEPPPGVVATSDPPYHRDRWGRHITWTRNMRGLACWEETENPCFYSEEELATSANHTRSCTSPKPERRLLKDDVVQRPNPSHLKIKHQPWQH